tara:strand:- start:1131 stop:1394 length:264 start_codon:yes stop_codon:yes gene_type:complete
MNEQEIKDLGFETQHETVESSGSDKDWYYYTLDIGEICLITNDNEEALNSEWQVEIFDFPSCIIKDSKDLYDLIKILKSNTKPTINK